MLLGIIVELAQRGVADAALGRGCRAQKRGVVVGVRQQAQIRQHILNLCLVVKTLPARNLIRNPRRAQCVFKQPRLVVAAIQNGKIGKICAVNQLITRDLLGNEFRFVRFALARHHAHHFALAQLRPQRFGEQLWVVGNHLVRHLQNPRGGTIILLQFDDFYLRIILLQTAQILHIRPAPRINRLVVIAHRRKPPLQAHQRTHQRILASVGVLAFVNQQILQTLLPLQARFRILLQQQRGQPN